MITFIIIYCRAKKNAIFDSRKKLESVKCETKKMIKDRES